MLTSLSARQFACPTLNSLPNLLPLHPPVLLRDGIILADWPTAAPGWKTGAADH